MSGRAKRILYHFVLVFLCVAAIGGVLTQYYFARRDVLSDGISYTISFHAVIAVMFFLPWNVLIHECGHLIFGLLAGLKPISVSVGWLEFSRKGIRFSLRNGYAGKTVMLPKKQRGTRGRLAIFALGGAFLNLVYGAIFLTLYFVLPVTPALLFFELFAPFNLLEGLLALYPAELSAGRTDGKILLELARNTAYSKVFTAVLTAQGLLEKHTFEELPRELLFGLPVVREDEPAFLALTQLRWQYLIYNGDEEGARAQLYRLESLLDELNGQQRAETACDLAYFAATSDRAHAEELFQDAAAAKGTLSYLRTQAALSGEGKQEALLKAEQEHAVGIRELEKLLLSRL